LQLAFSTLGCPEWSLDQIVDAAVQHGYSAVEIRGIEGHVDLRQSPHFQSGQRADTGRAFRNAGLQICCLGSSASFADPQKRSASIQETRAYIEIAADLGCPMVRVFGGSAPADHPAEETVSRVAECLTGLAPVAEAHGVTLVLETHDAFSTGRRVAEVLAKVGHSAIGALWDLHHPFREGEDPTETFLALSPYLRHAHVKDSRDGRYCLLGEGDLPVPEMLTHLAHAPVPFVSLEWEKRWHPEIAEPEVAFPQYAHTLRTYLSSFTP
jgi:sugar phosphate isomerase/epimerase